MNEWRKIAGNLSLVGQIGLSFIMPLLISVGLCAYLVYRFEIGAWIYIPGFILGLGASFVTAYNFYTAETKKAKKEEKKTTSFNRHI